MPDRLPAPRPQELRTHWQRYLGGVHGVIVAVAATLAFLSLPTDRELSTRLAGDALGSAALRQAKLELAELPEDAPPLERARAWRHIGLAQGLTGDVDGMLASLRNAILLAPQWLAGRLALADALHALARPAEATPELLAALAAAGRVPGLAPDEQRQALQDFDLPPGRPPTLAELPRSLEQALLPWRRRAAQRLAFEQKTNEAIEQYRLILRASPMDVPAAIRLLQLLAQDDREEEARTALVELLERLPPVLSPSAELPARVKSLPPAAIRRLLRALRVQWHQRSLGPTYGPLARLLDLPCSTVASSDATASATTELAVIDLLRSGVTLDETRRNRLLTLWKYLKIDPQDVAIRLEVAGILEAAGNYSGALALYRGLPDQPQAVLRLLGTVGTYEQLASELGSRYERARDVKTGLWLARLHSWNGHYRRSEEMFRRLLREHAADPAVLRGLAQALQAQAKHAEAIGALRELLGKLPAEAAAIEAPAARSTPVATAASGVLPRRLLALYLREVELGSERSRIHRRLEVVLDRLGFVVDYRAIEDGLPRPEEMGAYAGVVTWFDLPVVPEAGAFVKWLAAQAAAGRKLVMMGGLGALVDASDGRRLRAKDLQESMAPLGLRHDGAFSAPGAALRVARKTRAVEHERPLGRELLYFESVRSVDPANEVLLTVQHPDGSLADVVVLSKAGLYVSPGYAAYEDPVSQLAQLRVDAFDLLGRLFGVSKLPVPDPTTVNGRRAALVHVDGDGASNSTSLRGYTMCVDALLERVFERFPIEQTVSFIASEVSPGRLGTEPLRKRARDLYRLSWIEPASHSFSHPFDWQNPDASIARALRHEYNYGITTFDARRELAGSCEIVADLAPARQAPPLLLWSGSCNPDGELLAKAREWGILNMNGGDGAFDGLRPSVTSLAPFVRTVGGELQFLAPNANEYFLTEEGKQPLWAFCKLQQTWERSESPRRLEAMNLYYHHYIARSEDGMQVLESLYERMMEQSPCFISATERVRMIHGFRSAAIRRLGPDRFAVENTGRCLTLRCDPSMGIPDLTASIGVAGYCDGPGGVRYVHLAPGARHQIAFAQSPAPAPIRLVSSTLRLASWTMHPDRLDAVLAGFGPARIELQGAWLAAGAAPSISGPGLPDTPFTVRRLATDRALLEATARGMMQISIARPR